MERNELIQQFKQIDSEIQHGGIHSEKTQLIPSISEKVKPQQIARSEFSAATPFVFHVITERQKRAFITIAINFSKSVICISTNSLLFEKHCKDN